MLDTAKFLFHKSTIFDMTNYLFFRLLQKTKSLSNCYVYNTARGLLSQQDVKDRGIVGEEMGNYLKMWILDGFL